MIVKGKRLNISNWLDKELSVKDLEEYADLVERGVLVPVWLHSVNRRETLLECFIRWKGDKKNI